MQTFKASEIMQVGIKIEENGEKLYKHARSLADEAKMKDFFGFLAGEEAKHKQVFQEMLSKAEPYEPPETYPGEYFAYLRAYADHIVFPADVMEEELDDLDDIYDVVEFALQREIESILYYIEAKSLMPKGQAELLDKMIEEERRHYLKLVDVLKTLD
jgi:rubrerythrin